MASRPCLRIDGANALLATEWRALGGCLTRGDDFDLLWLTTELGWASPLASRQRINRFPGIASIADKHKLANVSTVGSWDFVPFSTTSVAVAHSHPHRDDPFSWVIKGGAHRSVNVLPRLPDSEDGLTALLSSPTGATRLLQRRVPRQMRLVGRAFDLGVYTLLSSERSGRLDYWVFDDVLLRFCPLPFIDATVAARQLGRAGGPALAGLQRGWVIPEDYLSVWQLPGAAEALRSVAAAAGSNLASLGASPAIEGEPRAAIPLHAKALATLLGGHGREGGRGVADGDEALERLWERMRAAIATALRPVVESLHDDRDRLERPFEVCPPTLAHRAHGGPELVCHKRPHQLAPPADLTVSCSLASPPFAHSSFGSTLS